jgi:hypothetical protein
MSRKTVKQRREQRRENARYLVANAPWLALRRMMEVGFSKQVIEHLRKQMWEDSPLFRLFKREVTGDFRSSGQVIPYGNGLQGVMEAQHQVNQVMEITRKHLSLSRIPDFDEDDVYVPGWCSYCGDPEEICDGRGGCREDDEDF